MDDTAESLLREIVECEPIVRLSTIEDHCVYCGRIRLKHTRSEYTHNGDCLWLRAKKLLEQYDKWSLLNGLSGWCSSGN